MEINQFYLLFKQKKGALAVVLLSFLVMGAILTVIQPFKYESKSEILIIQESNATVDPYTAAKSNEYLSNILAQVVATNSFYNEVAQSSSNIDLTYFPVRADQKIKKWRSTVSASALNDSGIVSVSVFHADQNQALLISNAINNVLIAKNNLYIGASDKIKIKVLNEPIVSRWPVKPNLILIFSLSLVFGLIFFICYLLLYPNRMEHNPMRPVDFVRMNGLDRQKESREKLMESILAPEENKIVKSIKSVKNYSEIETESAIKESAVNQPSSEIFAPRQDLNLSRQGVSETGEKELTYEDIIKKGNIKNIFGRQDPGE